uniref:ATP synthase F0 subunit 8 n=1 Tax=Halocynthia aurantium TaxID=254849 RepID=A0A7L8Y3N0_HALAU|nr:ATP synthase F0 subunit 8 [Halocynthia aurantium]QOI13829.1 ATP synthase F0 subunit 8 [Halocynthia aurantium]
MPQINGMSFFFFFMAFWAVYLFLVSSGGDMLGRKDL